MRTIGLTFKETEKKLTPPDEGKKQKKSEAPPDEEKNAEGDKK